MTTTVKGIARSFDDKTDFDALPVGGEFSNRHRRTWSNGAGLVVYHSGDFADPDLGPDGRREGGEA